MVDVKLFQTEYDRSTCNIGVVHLGYGAFHRAHQAIYIDDYMNQTGDTRWQGLFLYNLEEAVTIWTADFGGQRSTFLLC